MLRDAVKSFGTTGRGVSARENIILKTMKAVHLLSATAWAGGALAMQTLGFLRLNTLEDPAFAAVVQYCLHHVDTWVVMPGLAGCLLTGIFYSWYTAFGFFKYLWVGYKWIVSLAACFWGTLFWGPWGDTLIAALVPHGLDAPLRFVRSCILPEDIWAAILQSALIFSMLIISVYRPLSLRSGWWFRRKHTEG
jgi:hypothetical protein